MEPGIIIGGIGAASAAGFGIRVGTKLIPIGIDARNYLGNWRKGPGGTNNKQSASRNRERRALDLPAGRKRTSSIAGIYRDVLRHNDGSYTRFYRVPLQETMLAHDLVSERRS